MMNQKEFLKMNDIYVGSFSDLTELVHKGDQEWIYKCPFCVIAGKTPDKIGKFSFNVKKNKGHCWRCGSVVIDKSLYSKDQLLDIYFNNDEEKELNETINKYNDQSFDISFWTKSVLDNKDSRDYMVNKRKINEDILERFNVKVCENPRLGVLFLDRLDNRSTNFFQIRNINSKTRHTFIKNVIKPISWLSRIENNEVILAEGFSSALSVYKHMSGNCSPLVATGKSITKFQKYLFSLNKENIKKLTICFDGGFINDAIKAAKTLYNLNFPIYIMNLECEKDPNDVEKEDFLKSFENRVLYSPLKENIIKNILLRYE